MIVIDLDGAATQKEEKDVDELGPAANDASSSCERQWDMSWQNHDLFLTTVQQWESLIPYDFNERTT